MLLHFLLKQDFIQAHLQSGFQLRGMLKSDMRPEEKFLLLVPHFIPLPLKLILQQLFVLLLSNQENSQAKLLQIAIYLKNNTPFL